MNDWAANILAAVAAFVVVASGMDMWSFLCAVAIMILWYREWQLADETNALYRLHKASFEALGRAVIHIGEMSPTAEVYPAHTRPAQRRSRRRRAQNQVYLQPHPRRPRRLLQPRRRS